MYPRTPRVEAFVSLMLDGLDTQLANNGGCTYFMPAPAGLSDAELNAAAQALHDAGRICMWGLTHNGSKYSRAFVAFRICTPECYPHYREARAREGVWLTGFICTVVTALMCFLGEYVFPGWFWPAMGVAGLAWGLGCWMIRRDQVALRNLEIPSEPVFGWVSYG